MAIRRNPATGKIIAHRFDLGKLMAAAENYHGFCRACGAERTECEPDARRYPCEACGLNHVYGAEELVLMEAVK